MVKNGIVFTPRSNYVLGNSNSAPDGPGRPPDRRYRALGKSFLGIFSAIDPAMVMTSYRP